MSLALELAAEGVGSVEPNPAVGCLIEKSGRIIGRGKHERYGGPHAEINALTDCHSRRTDPEGATIYVTLEPCCHRGKTGPCSEAIIRAKPAEVVIAAQDPSAHADGTGIRQLREAGIRVTVGVCAAEARRLNAPFYHFVQTGKTWIVLKWAQSLDGKLAHVDPTRNPWISGEQSRADAHRLRRRTQAILVGINTVLIDNPLMTPRPSGGRRPLRIVMDSDLRIPLNSQLLQTASDHPLLIVTDAQTLTREAGKAKEIERRGGQILTRTMDIEHGNLRPLQDELRTRGVQQLLVEGGPKTLGAFLEQGLANEVCVYIAPMVLGVEGCASLGTALARKVCQTPLCHLETKRLGPDLRLRGLTAPIT